VELSSLHDAYSQGSYRAFVLGKVWTTSNKYFILDLYGGMLMVTIAICVKKRVTAKVFTFLQSSHLISVGEPIGQ